MDNLRELGGFEVKSEHVTGALRPTDPAKVRRVLFGTALWVGAAWATLRVADIPGEYGGSMCGVWGCYPPLQALIAMHLFWCVAVVPIVWAAARYAPHRLRRAGVAIAATATLVVTVAVGRDVADWMGGVAEQYRPHWPKRAAYALFTLSDAPVIQSLLAGVVCAVLGRTRRGAKPHSEDRPPVSPT